MGFKLSLSTISALIECLEKYDEVEGQAPEQMINENLRQFGERKSEQRIHRRDFIDLFIVENTSLEPIAMAHLFLASFLLTGTATTLTIHEFLKSHFSDDVNFFWTD